MKRKPQKVLVQVNRYYFWLSAVLRARGLAQVGTQHVITVVDDDDDDDCV